MAELYVRVMCMKIAVKSMNKSVIIRNTLMIQAQRSFIRGSEGIPRKIMRLLWIRQRSAAGMWRMRYALRHRF